MKYDSSPVRENCTEALRYASLGYYVYPNWGVKDGKCLCKGMPNCRPGKHPCFVAHGFNDASANPDVICRWFKGSGVNVGIHIIDFAILDFDRRNGGMETLAEWERRFGMPIAPIVKSGDDGRHYYLDALPFPVPQKIVIAKGVDLLTGGGVIAPPSNHIFGGRYDWLTALETPRSKWHTWLIDIVQKAMAIQPPSAEPKEVDAFDPMRGIVSAGQTFADLGLLPSGERNEAVNRIIGSMLGNGMTPEQILEDGLRWAGQQEPPYSVDDLTAKVRSFWARQRTTITDLGFEQDSPMHQGESVEAVRSSPFADAGKDEATPPPFQPFTLHGDAFYGLAGEVVRTILPHTEADEVSLLLDFLVCFGNCLGHNAYFQVSGDYHYSNLFALTIASTSVGKGLAWGAINYLFKNADDSWFNDCLMNGIGTGEGLIERVRDANGDDLGVADKRCLVIETEFLEPSTKTEPVMSVKAEPLGSSEVVWSVWSARRPRSARHAKRGVRVGQE